MQNIVKRFRILCAECDADLSVLTGYEHEAWNLSDYVRVEDKDLGGNSSTTTRIVRREYNLQEPWNTVLELSTTLKNLGSSVSSIDTSHGNALEIYRNGI